MFRRVATAALIAGLLGGLTLTGVQAIKVLPLLFRAEAYEAGAAPVQAAKAEARDHDAGWTPGEGIERVSLTLLANVLVGIGFGFLISAGALLRGGIDWREGILWGLGGFAAVHLAPALGLPPEPPGVPVADVYARQLWWFMTAAATAGGLALIVFASRPALKTLGGTLIALPHLVGAPHASYDLTSAVPAQLAAAFVTATLVANLLFWITIGGVSGYVLHRFAKD